jgi:uncharacterized protein (TIGR02145 family)
VGYGFEHLKINHFGGIMIKVKILWTVCALAFASMMIFSCSDPGTGTVGGGTGGDAELREYSVGKTEDGHDVLVFHEGVLDDYLFDINIISESDTGCGAVLTFRNLEDSKIPRVGDIIASAETKTAPYGFLYKVLGVSTDDGVTTVTVRCAGLEEAIEDVDFKMEVELDFDEDGELIDGLQKANIIGVSRPFNVNRRVNLRNGNEVTATASYSMTFDFELKISKWSVERFETSLSQRGEVRLSATLNREMDHLERLGAIDLPTIRFMIGLVPVSIKNEIVANLRVTSRGATIDVPKAEGSFRVDHRYGVHYTRDDGWRKIDYSNRRDDLVFDHHLNGFVRIGVLIGLESKIYGTVGLGLDAGPVLDLTVNGLNPGVHVFDNGFESIPRNSARLDLGLEYGARVTLSVVGYRLNYTFLRGYTHIHTIRESSYLPPYSIRNRPSGGFMWIAENNEISIISTVFTQRGYLSYPINKFGICVERAGSNECVDGGGMREVMNVDRITGNSFDTRFIVEPGIYNVRPYFVSDKSTFYDKADPYASMYTFIAGIRGDGDVVPRGTIRNVVIGTQIPVEAVPSDGYQFVSWRLQDGEGVSTIADTSVLATYVTVNTHTTVVANFERRPTYRFTMVRNPDLGGITTPPVGLPGFSGTQFEITATPREALGFTFVNWTVEGGAAIADANSPITTIILDSNAVITANFQQATTYVLRVSKNMAVGGGAISLSQAGIAPGTQIDIWAIPETGYTFVNWTVEGDGIIADANARATSVIVNGNATVTANFQALPRYTLTVNRNLAIGGTVTPTGVQTDILAGTQISIMATPASGYAFINWTVEGGGTIINANARNTSVTVNTNTVVTANFQLNLPPGSFVDARDGQIYRYVTIGTQTWMAENLNFNASGSFCYDNVASNCDTYGRLYDWVTVMGFESSCNENYCVSLQSPHRGICPVGWHVPSRDEWEDLIKYVEPDSIYYWWDNLAGLRLKSTNGWRDWDGNDAGNGTDDFGFSALPINGNSGAWWSATGCAGVSGGCLAEEALAVDMEWQSPQVRVTFGRKPGHLSVRCLQDVSP